jgi:hypothetical protein
LPPPPGRRLPPTGRDYPPHPRQSRRHDRARRARGLSGQAHGWRHTARSARQAVRQAERELAAYLEGVAAAGLSPGQYADGARQRGEAIEVARERLATLLERERTSVDGDPLEAWARMDQAQRNRLLRSLIEAVIVVPVGRGRRVPVGERARVVGHGAGLVERYRGGGVPLPIRTLDFPTVTTQSCSGIARPESARASGRQSADAP